MALPLKDDITGLELSRFVDGGQTVALLVESPEPVDFTQEVAVSLVHRRRVAAPPAPPAPRPTSRTGAAAAGALRERLERLTQPPAQGTDRDRPPVDDAILDVDAGRRGLRLELHAVFGGAGDLAVVTVDTDHRALLYRGRVGPPSLVPASDR